MLSPGTTLGPYEIVSKLSTGGMAHLFLARRTGPGGFQRIVVIKVVKQHLATQPDFVRMFLDEARIASRLHHPNVVQIVELGEGHGLHYLVMEFVRGASLAELLGRLAELDRRLLPAPAAAIAAAAAAGLHAAHETRAEDGSLLHVIHRDVSPQNVLLGSKGEVKVIDFGIAKARGRMHETAAGSGWKGKLRYMSPEQIEGKPLDRRVDVYALGVVLWEMLTMRRLFQEENDMQVMMRIRAGEHPPPGAFVPAIPFALDALVLEMLHRDPNRRPQSAREVRTRLREAIPESKGVDDLELAALVFALCAPTMNQHFEPLSGSTPLNTEEMKILPQRALGALTASIVDNPESDSDALTLPASSLLSYEVDIASYDSAAMELSESDLEDEESVTDPPIELARRSSRPPSSNATRTPSGARVIDAPPAHERQVSRHRQRESDPPRSASQSRSLASASDAPSPASTSGAQPRSGIPWGLIVAAIAGTLVGAGSVTLIVRSQQAAANQTAEYPPEEAIGQAFDLVLPELRRCAGSQSGQITVELNLESSGDVVGAAATGRAFDEPSRECMVRALRRLRIGQFRAATHKVARSFPLP